MSIFEKIPADIFNEKIMPYTYNTQPIFLIRDIKSFVFIYKNIKTIYKKYYLTETDAMRDLLIKHHLIDFCNSSLNMKLDYWIFIVKENTLIKLLAKMTPVQRVRFLIRFNKN